MGYWFILCYASCYFGKAVFLMKLILGDLVYIRILISKKLYAAGIKYQKCQRYAETTIRIKPHSALSYPSY